MVTSTVTVNDYISAHRLHHRRRTRMWYAIWLGVLVAGIVLAILGAKIWGPAITMGGIGALLGHWWDDRVGLPEKVKKLYAQFKGIDQPGELTWDSEHIEGRSARGHGKRMWKDYIRFMENDDVFLLYVTDQLWEAIPKRGLTQEQIAEIRGYASKAGEI